jgi:hypothetical protein
MYALDYSSDAEAKKYCDLPIKPTVAHTEYYIYNRFPSVCSASGSIANI